MHSRASHTAFLHSALRLPPTIVAHVRVKCSSQDLNIVPPGVNTTVEKWPEGKDPETCCLAESELFFYHISLKVDRTSQCELVIYVHEHPLGSDNGIQPPPGGPSSVAPLTNFPGRGMGPGVHGWFAIDLRCTSTHCKCTRLC